MLLYAHIAYLFTLKLPGWELINFEYYQHEACSNWPVLLSTDCVTPVEKQQNFFFFHNFNQGYQPSKVSQ